MPLEDEGLPASPAGEGVAPGSPPAAGTDSSAPAAGEPGGVAGAAAPAAGGGDGAAKAPKTVLDAVLQGMEKDKKAGAGAPPDLGGKPAGEQPPAAGAEPSAGGTKDEKLLGKEGQERIRGLVSQVKQLEPKARYFDEMSEWVTRNGLTTQDVSYALNLIRLVKNDPAKAAELLDPLVTRVRTYQGERLPQDIQDQLDAGTITESAAKELAARRAGDALRREQDTRARAQSHAEQQRQEVERHAVTVGQAVSQWERDWQSSDPDYAKKQKFVSARISHLMTTEGVPSTAEQAVEMAKKARQEVEQEMAGLLPPARHIVAPTGGGTRQQAAAPKTSLEAAQRGLQNASQQRAA